jgi:signal-transduction protein with cAMP-binding, CBS, and nucleotidyltransferase domain
MRIAELMHTPAVMCRSSTTVEEVARLMRDRNVGSVVVIDRIGYLSGIVTDRDIVLRALAEKRPSDIAVEQIMTRDVATVSVHADGSEAASIMARRAVRRLPVVDDHDHIYGMLTLDDLVRQLGAETDRMADTVLMQTQHFALP